MLLTQPAEAEEPGLMGRPRSPSGAVDSTHVHARTDVVVEFER